MLYGEYQHNMDPKGRVTIPSKFREDLGEKFYVCKGIDSCLFVYCEEEWQKLVDKISSLPISQTRDIQRHFFSGAADLEADKQGRILLPQPLRDYAKLQKGVTVIGSGKRAEIWSTENWTAYQESQSEENLQNVMEALGI